MFISDFDAAVETASVRADVLEHLRGIEDMMRVQANLMALSIRIALNPPETEEDKRAFAERLDALSNGGHYFSE